MITSENLHDQILGWFIPPNENVSCYPPASLMGFGLEPTGGVPPAGNAFENPDTRACIVTGIAFFASLGGAKTLWIYDYDQNSNSGPLRMRINHTVTVNATRIEDFSEMPGGGILFKRGMRVVVNALNPGTSGTARINFRRI